MGTERQRALWTMAPPGGDYTEAKCTTDAITLIATPHPDPKHSGSFVATLESGQVVVERTRQPLADGARALIGRGLPIDTPVNLRHADRPYPSFEPMPAEWWAQWTFEESASQPLRRVLWMPFAEGAGGQKSASEEVSGPPLPAITNAAVGAHAPAH
jgi:hypothetical protein